MCIMLLRSMDDTSLKISVLSLCTQLIRFMFIELYLKSELKGSVREKLKVV